ncbi:hypothetical protein EYC95_11870 [Pseudomonas sp. BGI-2]|nr:hypothetical protein EYC95_11870 [Pseudomonas sp. BGI-2]
MKPSDRARTASFPDDPSTKFNTNPVGASLLAIADSQPTSMLNVIPSSRASSPPQGFRVKSTFCAGASIPATRS